MEESRCSHGRADDQWCASHAPAGWVHRGVQARRVEGDIGVRRCLHAARDTVCSDQRQTGQLHPKHLLTMRFPLVMNSLFMLKFVI